MRQLISLYLIFSTFAAANISQVESDLTSTLSICPFATPRALEFSNQQPLNPLEALLARQVTVTVTGAASSATTGSGTSSCPASYFGCSNLNPSACCSSNAYCTTDSNRVVGCCPSTAYCTGTIGGSNTNSGAAATNSQGSNGGTAVSSNNVVIVTANSVSNGVAKVETGEALVLGILVGIFGLIA